MYIQALHIRAVYTQALYIGTLNIGALYICVYIEPYIQRPYIRLYIGGSVSRGLIYSGPSIYTYIFRAPIYRALYIGPYA